MAKRNPKSNAKAENERKIYSLATLLADRTLLASYLGKSFNGDRDIYTTLGYKTYLQFADYEARFRRDPLAKRIINAPSFECWGEMPEVVETEEKDTAFEIAWKELVKSQALLDAFSAVDRLAGIGEYAVLLLGLDDPNATNLELEATRAAKLLFLAAYDQDSAEVVVYDQNASSPRYGLPLFYNLKMSISAASSMTRRVHHSRIIHIAEDCLKNRVAGTPRLEAVFNNLQNVELVACGSSEMFWRGAFPGLGFMQEKDSTEFSEAQKTEFAEQIENYVHGLKRYMRLKNMSIEELTVQVADPTTHVGVQIDLIAAGTGIPKRILMGSERGELASSQDERHWAKMMQNRQKRHCEPKILWPFIDRLIGLGILPQPANPLEAHWRDLLAPSAKEVADVGLVRAQAIAAITNALGALDIVSLELVQKKVLGLSDEEISLELERLKQIDQEANSDLPEGQE